MEDYKYPTLRAFNHFNAEFTIPAIVTIGIIINAVVLGIFLCTPLRRISTSGYFAALSITDVVYLVFLGISWVEGVGIQIPHINKQVMCPLMEFVAFVTSFLSIWYTVAFTAGLYTSTYLRGLHEKLSKPKRSVVISVMLALFACLIYTFTLFQREIFQIDETTSICLFTGSTSVVLVTTIADTLLTFIIPFSLLLFMNIRVLFFLNKLSKNTNNRAHTNGGMETTPNSTSHSRTNLTTSLVSDFPINDQFSVQLPRDNTILETDSRTSHSNVHSPKLKRTKTPHRKYYRQRHHTMVPLQSLQTSTSDTDRTDRTVDPSERRTAIRYQHQLSSDAASEYSTLSVDYDLIPVLPLQRRCLRIVTITLVILLFFNLPTHVMRFYILVQLIVAPSSHMSELENQLHQLFQTINYLNFVFNLLTYVACARRFQKSFGQVSRQIAQGLSVVCCKKCKCKSLCAERRRNGENANLSDVEAQLNDECNAPVMAESWIIESERRNNEEE